MEDDNRDVTDLKSAERHVQAQSARFKKELGVKDIVLAQILTLVGGYGIGTAAKAGSPHLLLWLLAILLFFLPLASVVIFLNRLLPLEGGPYQWAKVGFNPRIGFLVAWNTWLFAIVYLSSLGLSVATSLSYALGPQAAWMAGNKAFLALVSGLVISALAMVATLGLGVGKWVHNTGGIILLLIFAVLLALPVLKLAYDPAFAYPPLTLILPPLSLLTATIFVKMAVFSFGGFEYVAILAGECRNPSRTITRAVLIAAPLIALMYILGTNSVLAFSSPQTVDLINPFAQVFALGFGSLATTASLVSGLIVAMLVREMAQASLTFTGNTRLPMVAGWDHLLPVWFTRLHTRYQTPVNSIVFVGAMMLCLALAGLLQVGQQEAYQLLQSAAGIFISSTQLVLFALPLVGLKGTPVPLWIKLTSVSGFLMTFLFIVLSIIPIIEVESGWAYSAKIITLIIVANLVGLVILLAAERSRNSNLLS